HAELRSSGDPDFLRLEADETEVKYGLRGRDVEHEFPIHIRHGAVWCALFPYGGADQRKTVFPGQHGPAHTKSLGVSGPHTKQEEAQKGKNRSHGRLD